MLSIDIAQSNLSFKNPEMRIDFLSKTRYKKDLKTIEKNSINLDF